MYFYYLWIKKNYDFLTVHIYSVHELLSPWKEEIKDELFLGCFVRFNLLLYFENSGPYLCTSWATSNDHKRC